MGDWLIARPYAPCVAANKLLVALECTLGPRNCRHRTAWTCEPRAAGLAAYLKQVSSQEAPDLTSMCALPVCKIYAFCQLGSPATPEQGRKSSLAAISKIGTGFEMKVRTACPEPACRPLTVPKQVGTKAPWTIFYLPSRQSA